MKYPKFLKDYGNIGLIAPSFGCTIEPYNSRLNSAIEKLNNLGYRVSLGPNCLKDDGIGKSTSAQLCAKEINESFFDSNYDIIISCGGGETMCEDLSFVDFKSLAQSNPKWFMGYSDNTNLTFTLTTICDIASIYGPCISNFGMHPWDKSIEDTLSLLKGEKLTFNNYPLWEKDDFDTENPYAPYNLTEDFKLKIYNAKNTCSFSGRLIGGCLDCLQILCGTTFDNVSNFSERYKEDGIIWYLESCDLNPMGIRRALWQLDNSDWFKYVKGFLIGRAYHFDEDLMGMNRLNAVYDYLKKFDVPIIMDLDIGHLPPMIPLINGSIASVSVDNNSFNIAMSLK